MLNKETNVKQRDPVLADRSGNWSHMNLGETDIQMGDKNRGGICVWVIQLITGVIIIR